MQAKKPKAPHPRPGFTLIELMIAIVIIAILAALLIPTVGMGIRRARVAGVVSEISLLETAIAKFKTDHGIEPPSSIFLYEQGTTNASAGYGWASDAASMALIRQMWPQYDFAGDYDINGDGAITPSAMGSNPIKLTQGECLVFFLGGINGNDTASMSSTSVNNNPNNGATTYIGGSTGFSKSPTSPFTRGGSREAPLFEFNVGRFTDLDNDGFPEYKDSLPGQASPYLYYSAYDSQGYVITSPAPYAPVAPEFGGGGLTIPYSQGTSAGSPYWKPNSHQLISPGYDGQYGAGGAYVAKGNPTLPGSRPGEADNITNFSSGELGQ